MNDERNEGAPTDSGPPGRSEVFEGEFSPFIGGPLFQLFRRVRLTDDALGLVRRRMIVISLVAWLPLLVLSLFERLATGTRVAVPFLLDVEVHARLLVAMPLLVVAELVVHQRVRKVIRQFLAQDLVPQAERARFDSAIRAAIRLRNSTFAELILIAAVYLVGVELIWRQRLLLDAETWYRFPAPRGGFSPTITGYWYGLVSIPLFQFLMVRWYFRLVVWFRFLWHVSRIELNLIPTHPDRAAGLGFLSGFVHAFAPLLTAHGVLLAGTIANRILYAGASLIEFKVEIVAVVLALLLVVGSPPLVFSRQILAAKRQGLREYGVLAQRYVREFEGKWLRGGAPLDEPLVGTPDLQSLADLDGGFQVIRTIRVLPVGREMVVQLAFWVLVPLLPLTLTLFSLEDLIDRFVSMIF